MNNNALNAMFEEEEENNKFEEWGRNSLSFFDDLSEDERKQLKSDYKNANTCKEIYSNTMSMAIRGRSGIDYSTDVEKAGEQMVMTSNRLDETLSTLSEKHGNIRSR